MKTTRYSRSLVVTLVVIAALYVVTHAEPPAAQPADRTRPGGDLTTDVQHAGAYGQSAPNLPTAKLLEFTAGNRVFTTNWVTAPASVKSFDGLGPLFNRVSCSACHLRDGRGQPPVSPEAEMESMLVRLSVPGEDAHGGPLGHPVYGGQLQDRAILGVPPEGRCSVSYSPRTVTLADGTAVELRVPTYTFVDLQYGPLGEDILYSPRVAPSVFGLGLLEAIPEAMILAHADPDDRDGDGISGRPNRVWHTEQQATVLGRFGWKANAADLREQAAGAANGDIGLTTTVNPQQNVGTGQTAAAEAYAQEGPELSEKFLDRLVFYTRTLAVPAARNTDDEQVLRGRNAFQAANCQACHVESYRTGHDPAVPQLANQTIFPYTDLLLHDMGEGLADGRPDFAATGREWRTPPLWGVGLQETVSGHTTFLHDGRARNLTEAILWHDGEAAASREAFAQMSAAERAALIAFLNSL